MVNFNDKVEIKYYKLTKEEINMKRMAWNKIKKNILSNELWNIVDNISDWVFLFLCPFHGKKFE